MRRAGRRGIRLVTLQVDSLAFGGDGVGREEDGRVVFLPGTAPGDLVEAWIVEEHSGYSRAEVARIVEPSPQRIEPSCPLFAAGCGGCQWPHVTIEAQREAKRTIVTSALRRATKDVEPVRAPTADWQWRRRARLHWGRRDERGAASLGYTARRTHRLIAVERCPQLEAQLEQALGVLQLELVPHLFSAGEVWLLLGGRGEVHVAVVAKGILFIEPAAAALVGRGGIVGVALRDGSRSTVFGAAEIDLADEDTPFFAAADTFAQASATGNGELRRLVGEAAAVTASDRTLELYAGSGNFTRDLARSAPSVVAVEEVATAVELGTRNLGARGLAERVRWISRSAERAVADLAAAGETFDLVVLDPPRSGLPAELVARLPELMANRIVYVSCDPTTLGRDLAALTATGSYRVTRVVPVDLMPQTYHVEVVVKLERVG